MRAESLCANETFRAAADAARNEWNSQHPDYSIDPVRPCEAEDRILGHIGLARAEEYSLNHGKVEEWLALQPAIIDWFNNLAELHIKAFPPVIFDVSFAEGQAIGMKFIESYFLRGPEPLKGACNKCFPSLKEIYERFAQRVVGNGSCLPLSADTTTEDMRDFAKYALPVIRASTVTGESRIGLAVDGLAAADFEAKEIAFRLGLTVPAVKARIQSMKARREDRQ